MTEERFAKARAFGRRFLVAVREDVSQFRPGFHVVTLISRLMPPQSGGELRVAALRQLGCAIGEGTRIAGTPRFQSGEQPLGGMLEIGDHCEIEVDVTLDLGERIRIGDRVTIGHQTVILTSSHELGAREHRAGALVRKPVVIESGAWLGARCVVLPGVTIGAGAIVAAGSMVSKDVAPNTRVGGVPAKALENLAP